MRTGSGTKLKVLEYFAAGKPVVATRKAVEGIGVQNGSEALLTDDAGEEFVQAIKTACTLEISNRLSEKFRAFAEQFEWSNIADKVRRVYESLT